MENIKELVYIVNRNKVKRIDMLDLTDESPSKVNALYQAISTGKVDSDEEASALLFPKAKSYSAYRNLKMVLKEKLLNTLFFIDAYQNGHSDRQSAFYEVYKDFAAAQMLIAKNARKVGVHLLEKILKKSKEFEFTDLSLMVVRLLRLHYGTRLGDQKRYVELNELSITYSEIASFENEAEQCYTDLVIHYINKLSTKEELQLLARRYYEVLAPRLPTVQVYKYHFYTGLVRLFEHTCMNNYVATIPICEELINFFEQKSFMANTPIQICLHHQLVAYMQLRNYELGNKVARRSQGLIEEGSFNWFKNLEYLFLLAMHTGNYQDAYQVFSEGIGHKRFKFLPKHIQEVWQLYQAYLHLLIDQGEVLPLEGDKNFTKFRINRFLNNMPLYSKDKRGMNIAILIVQILFYIQQRKYDTAIDGMEAIEKYCSRYLFKADTMRSYYFIKMLLAIPKASFHQKAAIRHAAVSVKKMKNIPTDVSYQFHKIEIIPYEALWGMALGMLGTQIVRIVKKTVRS
ncbi:MAG: hypothetical protein AB8H12_09885 [Lewinella sp.]